MSTATMQRVFNALNGRELKELILRDTKKVLDSDDRFKENLTYPLVDYSISVKILSDPKVSQTPEFVIEAHGKSETVEAFVRIPECEAIWQKPVAEFTVEKPPTGTFDPPDKMREEAGLPVSEPTVDKDLGLVHDKPKARKAAKPEKSPSSARDAVMTRRVEMRRDLGGPEKED